MTLQANIIPVVHNAGRYDWARSVSRFDTGRSEQTHECNSLFDVGILFWLNWLTRVYGIDAIVATGENGVGKANWNCSHDDLRRRVCRYLPVRSWVTRSRRRRRGRPGN